MVPALRSAVHDMSWLLSRGYAEDSTLAIVGNRYDLRQRQRMAVLRSACSDENLSSRGGRAVRPEDLSGAAIAIDGYNVLITVESALAGGVVILGRDGCARDLASIHGTYRRVEETLPAVEMVLRFLARLQPARMLWLFDRPVSNSGRLRGLVEDVAARAGQPMEVALSDLVDADLASFAGVVASSDSWVLDRARHWFGLAAMLVQSGCPDAWVIDLRSERHGG